MSDYKIEDVLEEKCEKCPLWFFSGCLLKNAKFQLYCKVLQENAALKEKIEKWKEKLHDLRSNNINLLKQLEVLRINFNTLDKEHQKLMKEVRK